MYMSAIMSTLSLKNHSYSLNLLNKNLNCLPICTKKLSSKFNDLICKVLLLKYLNIGIMN